MLNAGTFVLIVALLSLPTMLISFILPEREHPVPNKCDAMKPYNDTDGKKEQVRAMFDGIARRYDLLNHLLSLGVDRGWRRRVVRAVRAERPRSVLDMATGTADLAIMLAKSCPGARVVGVDLSERMLAGGRVKVERGVFVGAIESLAQGDARVGR